MNRDIAQRWVDALRSGDYEQGKERLARKGEDGKTKFCCLGVLCEIALADGIVERKSYDIERSDYYYRAVGNPNDESCTSLPHDVREWAGLGWRSGADPLITSEVYTDDDSDEHPASFVELNDSAGYTFAQIADIIERDHLQEVPAA